MVIDTESPKTKVIIKDGHTKYCYLSSKPMGGIVLEELAERDQQVKNEMLMVKDHLDCSCIDNVYMTNNMRNVIGGVLDDSA